MNIDNANKLIEKLSEVPPTRFDMGEFWSTDGDDMTQYECGTAACALGHGPMAGVPKPQGQDWLQYGYNFVTTEREWQWCFSGLWGGFDNTPSGAAQRIKFVLEFGVPEAFDINKDLSHYVADYRNI